MVVAVRSDIVQLEGVAGVRKARKTWFEVVGKDMMDH